MKNYPNIAIVASFSAMDGFLPTYNLQIYRIFLIFTFGILHGANDLLLKKYKSRKNNRSWIMILGYYVIVLTGVLLFI
jgi:hypothetical protein